MSEIIKNYRLRFTMDIKDQVKNYSCTRPGKSLLAAKQALKKDYPLAENIEFASQYYI